MESKSKNFKFAKLNEFIFKQMDMVYPVTSCLMVIVELIFGIYLVESMYGDLGISSIMGLRLISERWNPTLIYIWLINMEINYYLVIFVLFLCFVYFCLFFVFKKFSISSFCWVNPVTSCFTTVVAAGIGIGFCFFHFQCNDNYYHLYLRPWPQFEFSTNTWLECFYELFIYFLCYFCQIFCFWFCFYFITLCKKVKGWIIYIVGYKKKKER